MLQALPHTMRAVTIHNAGAHGSLALIEAPLPEITPMMVLVRVHAAGVNRADVFQVQGSYPFPSEANGILGMEFAGEIVALGSDVQTWQLGDKVCGIVVAGAYAEYVAVSTEHLLAVPENLSMIEAASMPEALATCYLSLYMLGGASAGKRALIHGGSSGVGVLGIQMLRYSGLEVFATAGNDAKCAACTELGAHAITYRTQDFVDVIKDSTQGKGVDVILDMVGGSYAPKNLKCLALRGHIISIAFMESAQVSMNLAGLLMKEATWHGTRLRAQDHATKTAITHALRTEFMPAIADGRIKPVISSVYPMENAEKAHATMQEGLHIGKIVLNMMRFSQ